MSLLHHNLKLNLVVLYIKVYGVADCSVRVSQSYMLVLLQTFSDRVCSYSLLKHYIHNIPILTILSVSWNCSGIILQAHSYILKFLMIHYPPIGTSWACQCRDHKLH